MRKKLMVVTAMLMAGSLFAAGCRSKEPRKGRALRPRFNIRTASRRPKRILTG
ncbi:MAG: hypothetical protein ACLTMP_08810 [Eggerthella lenta]